MKDIPHRHAARILKWGDNLVYNLTLAAKWSTFFILVMNGANLGHFVAEMGINGHKATPFFENRKKIVQILSNLDQNCGGGAFTYFPLAMRL